MRTSTKGICTVAQSYPDIKLAFPHAKLRGQEALGKDEASAYIFGVGKIAIYVPKYRRGTRVDKMMKASNGYINQRGDEEAIIIVAAKYAKEMCKEVGINTRGYNPYFDLDDSASDSEYANK
jgi:hypothetical protein